MLLICSNSLKASWGGAVLQQRWGSSHSGEDYFAAALKGVFLQCLGVGLLYSSTEGPQRFVGQAIRRASVEWSDIEQN